MIVLSRNGKCIGIILEMGQLQTSSLDVTAPVTVNILTLIMKLMYVLSNT